MTIERLITTYIERFKSANTIDELHEAIQAFIQALHTEIPEISLYQNPARETAEVESIIGMHSLYHHHYETEHLRVINGAICYLLVLTGTKLCYDVFTAEQPTALKLPFGQNTDLLSEGAATFLGWHKLATQSLTIAQHAIAFYAGLINDLGRVNCIRELYIALTEHPPLNYDETISTVLRLSTSSRQLRTFTRHRISFPTLNDMTSDEQSLVINCFAQPCTHSHIEQCKVPIQMVNEFGRTPTALRKFQFFVEFLSDVAGAVIPTTGTPCSLTMNVKTVSHLVLYWENLVMLTERLSKTPLAAYGKIWESAYQNYQYQRLAILDETLTELSSELMPIVIGLIGMTRTTEPSRAITIQETVDSLPKPVLDTLIRECHTYSKTHSISMFNFIALIGNITAYTDDFSKGLTVGLHLAAYLYNIGREWISKQSELAGTTVLDITPLAELFEFELLECHTGCIDRLYDLLTAGGNVDEALAEVFNKLVLPKYTKHGVGILVSSIAKTEPVLFSAEAKGPLTQQITVVEEKPTMSVQLDATSEEKSNANAKITPKYNVKL